MLIRSKLSLNINIVYLGAVLEGLAKFAHLINIEFFGDLVNVFNHLLEADFLTNR